MESILKLFLLIGGIIAWQASRTVRPLRLSDVSMINKGLLCWNFVGSLWVTTFLFFLLRGDAIRDVLIWFPGLILIGFMISAVLWDRLGDSFRLSNECLLFAALPLLGCLFLTCLFFDNSNQGGG